MEALNGIFDNKINLLEGVYDVLANNASKEVKEKINELVEYVDYNEGVIHFTNGLKIKVIE